MIKLMDILNEAQLTPYQIFSPGTGGKDMKNFKFNKYKMNELQYVTKVDTLSE